MEKKNSKINLFTQHFRRIQTVINQKNFYIALYKYTAFISRFIDRIKTQILQAKI